MTDAELDALVRSLQDIRVIHSRHAPETSITHAAADAIAALRADLAAARKLLIACRPWTTIASDGTTQRIDAFLARGEK